MKKLLYMMIFSSFTIVSFQPESESKSESEEFKRRQAELAALEMQLMNAGDIEKGKEKSSKEIEQDLSKERAAILNEIPDLLKKRPEKLSEITNLLDQLRYNFYNEHAKFSDTVINDALNKIKEVVTITDQALLSTLNEKWALALQEKIDKLLSSRQELRQLKENVKNNKDLSEEAIKELLNKISEMETLTQTIERELRDEHTKLKQMH